MKLCIIFIFLTISTNCLLQSCPSSYFFDIQHCEKCKDNCNCQIQNTCTSCIDGYTFYKGQCIQCPQANGIYGQCSGCCSREDQTILACTDCIVVPGMYSFLFSGRCILSDGCFEVDANGFCSECRNGYYETNNLCYSCHSSCATCTDFTNCITCADGYYWAVNNGGLCTACPNGCATCDLNGKCYSCLSYYYQYNDHCLQCPTNCETCVDGSTCTSCSSGILVSNLCIECTDTTYGGSTGCLSCVQNNNFIKCQQCADTYFLDSSTGVCRLCSNYITGTVRCRDKNTPTQCMNDHDPVLQNRHYLVGISCVANTKKCKKISDVQGNCATCYQGYKLNANNQCQLCPFVGCKGVNSTVISNICTCTQCNIGFYLPGGSVVCSACSTLDCAQCPADVCSKCLPGYYLSGGSCVAAIVSNCQVLATAATCATCASGYYLGSDDLCYACQSSCQECIDRFTCSKCATGYYIHVNNYCVKKPDNCVQYHRIEMKCTLCQHGYYLFNGFCQQCSVQKGTLSQCKGLCPIDYYIQELLTIKSNFQVHLIFCMALIIIFTLFFG